MNASERIQSFLTEKGVWYRTLEHPTTYTSPEMAASLHISGKEMAKAVVIKAKERFLMAVIPAHEHVDLEHFGQILGEKQICLATEKEMLSLFPDAEVGAEPPFGSLYGLEVYLDRSFIGRETLTFSAGTHHEAIQMKLSDYMHLVEPVVEEFAFVPLQKAGAR